MAGGKPPTPADVTAMLASARSKGKRSCDWPAEVALWMKRERGYETRGGRAPEPPRPAREIVPRPAPGGVGEASAVSHGSTGLVGYIVPLTGESCSGVRSGWTSEPS